jgi:outer membrane protein assembly factor BamB
MYAIRTLIILAASLVIPAEDSAPPRQPLKRGTGGLNVGPHDWPQWGGTSHRNNTPQGKNIPVTWNVKTGKNIKWKASLGSQTYGTPVVANGRVFVGTNNNFGRLKRFPPRVDLGVLMCFDEQTGKFLWQYSSPKLASGRVNDWPEQGICCTPLVDGNRLWMVTNRCEVVCLDSAGFRDGVNNGPYKNEPNHRLDEADVIWKFDMMKELDVFPHNMSTCSVTTDGKRLFVCTSNGVDADHITIPSPKAPSFLCMDRDTGKILWSDNSPGTNILHGQWASPTYFVIGKQRQVVFPGGDGWLYSFDPCGDGNGKSKLLWKFDCNPKTARWTLGGRGRRNNLCGMACFYKNRLYIGTGQDPEHGDGPADLWCIDPTKWLDGSDVSPTLALDKAGRPVPRRRGQAVEPKNGEREVRNPKSAALWHYTGEDRNRNGKLDFEEAMHRSIWAPTVAEGLLFIADFAGLVHCIDANTGKQYWTYDLFASAWSAPLIVDGKVYIGDVDGDVAIFPLTKDPAKALQRVKGELKPALGEINMNNAIYTTPVVANNVLFIANKNTLYAIAMPKKRYSVPPRRGSGKLRRSLRRRENNRSAIGRSDWAFPIPQYPVHDEGTATRTADSSGYPAAAYVDQ